MEWGRNSAEADIWVDQIRCIDNKVLEVIDEHGNIRRFDVYEL